MTKPFPLQTLSNGKIPLDISDPFVNRGRDFELLAFSSSIFRIMGFPFRKDDFDEVYETSLNHQSRYDSYSDVKKHDETLRRADESSDED